MDSILDARHKPTSTIDIVSITMKLIEEDVIIIADQVDSLFEQSSTDRIRAQFSSRVRIKVRAKIHSRSWVFREHTWDQVWDSIR
jgi:hypothetical protein